MQWNWEGRLMKNILTKLASAGVLMLSTTAAFAGSITQPGSTIGDAAGAPLPPGIYFDDETNWGLRKITEGPGQGIKVATGETFPMAVWSTPWEILGGRLSFAAGLPLREVGVTPFNHIGTLYAEGVFNPYYNGKLAWPLGGGFNFSYTAGGYARGDSQVAADTTVFEQRFALSYLANGWNLTGNVIWGMTDKPIGHTVSVTNPNPDYVNLDLTAIKSFGKWELGAVGFYSADESDPFRGYLRQKQFAAGGLAGYNFGPLSVQTYVTTDVWQKNFGGLDTRVFSRVVVPLGDPSFAPAPSWGMK
jgi:Putative MetA-pathway of phenol degradation